MGMFEFQIWIYFIVFVISITVVLNVIQKIMNNRYKNDLNSLEREKNIIDSKPILSELSKVEALANNNEISYKVGEWQNRYTLIKEKSVPKINDMILEADFLLDQMDYKNAIYKIAKIELEVYKVKNNSNCLLNEIKEITLCEERNRNVITELKVQYRELLNSFKENEKIYGEFISSIEMQFETIHKLFSDFEVVMENNEYNEVGNVVKAIDDSVKHMKIVIDEVPSIVLMTESLLPNKIEDVSKEYSSLISLGYVLDYIDLETNISEINKKIIDIKSKVKMLDMEDSAFELKTMLDYLDSLYNDFEKEKNSREDYEKSLSKFEIKLNRINTILERLHIKIAEIKDNYKLSVDDVEKISNIDLEISNLDSDYNVLISHTGNNSFPFSKLQEELCDLTLKLNKNEKILEEFLAVLASMHTDEERAREQFVEIKDVLFKSKEKVRSYKIPVMPSNYFVQLREAGDAVSEIVKELENKPINTMVLNTRVDTARDLVLKLYNTTNEMVKMAMMAEMAIVYGNRYRNNKSGLDRGLNNAEVYFNQGEYKKALEVSIDAINIIEPNIYDKLLKIYAGEN